MGLGTDTSGPTAPRHPEMPVTSRPSTSSHGIPRGDVFPEGFARGTGSGPLAKPLFVAFRTAETSGR
jgi:hypothetical protein